MTFEFETFLSQVICNTFLTAILWTHQSGLRTKITQQVRSPFFNQNRRCQKQKTEVEKRNSNRRKRKLKVVAEVEAEGVEKEDLKATKQVKKKNLFTVTVISKLLIVCID